MTDKTREELQAELEMRDRLDRERHISDGKYAPMLVKTIVYSAVSAFAMAVLYALISLVVKGNIHP